MQGQWIGEINGEYAGTLRVEVEKIGDEVSGNAYLFYDKSHQLPGFRFPLSFSAIPPYITETQTIYLFTEGGVMSQEDRNRVEAALTARFGKLPIPAKLNVELVLEEENLRVKWYSDDHEEEALTLQHFDIKAASDLKPRADLTTWDQFRQWAVSQRPRHFIFRGQSEPHKLATTFHRTWRKDLNGWIVDDVRKLFGVMAERLSFPLQLGNMEHNAAFWNILQHHGYPTPLLDWTLSPFVAAYFAFCNIIPGDARTPRIYIFDADAWNAKYGKILFFADVAPPQIVVLESMPAGNPRAMPQQSVSTVSNVADIEGFIRRREEEDGRSYLTVCDLAAEEAPKIMRELELMGITYGSVFPGLDGICRDMKDRLFAQQP
ncbi:FRG domain-containing protein [Sphingobium xenophagum]|uniref:FRG domain-containing protein n=1 Tax=Sphingobium xenophagum TaxID=121428 RepID=UPI001C0BC1AF|nr:FRG domain-containing protein [Sphingobium xenophagum]QWT15310.1 FRG domain-containing protein [Sphingobium xenophagum]